MKYKEVFKVYNLRDMNRNRIAIFFIAVSILLAMLVSLVIPQLDMGKQQYINKINKGLNKADLMAEVSFPSTKFDKKIAEYEAEGVKVERVSVFPDSFEYKGNRIMVYLLSGYDKIKDGEAAISKNFADANHIKIGDAIQLSDIDKNSKFKVTSIEQLPTEVTANAQVAGYIKVKDVKTMSPVDSALLFLSGKDGNTLKKELSKIEDGFKYYTYQERQEKMYADIDKEMGALSLISSIGFIMAISILVSGIIMMIIRAKKDLANLMLISIQKKDIVKAMRKEVNIMIFVPLVVAIVLSVPISMVISNFEGMVIKVNGEFIINTLKFVIFDILLFLIYRNLSLRYIKKLNPVLIEKGENSLLKLSFGEMICYLLPLPVMIFIYAALLQSGASVSALIFLATGMLLVFVVLWGGASLVSCLPLWKRWKTTLYTFSNLRSNKLVFVVETLNLTMLISFLLIGFNLGATLKKSLDENLVTNVPYNYIIKTSDTNRLKETLDHSKDINEYTKIHYIDTKIENNNIQDKSIRMNEIDPDSKLAFHILEGKNVFEGDRSQVLISEKYANAYHLNIGSILHIFENHGTHDYVVKGIYDSGGINVNWVLKASGSEYSNMIYLVNAKSEKGIKGLKNCYIANVDTVGSYSLSQANDFLKSFKILSILFLVSSVLFNIIIVHMGQQQLRKDYAILHALGIGKDIICRQILIKGILTTVLSLLISFLLYKGIMSIMMQLVSKGSANLNEGILVIAAIVATTVVTIGYAVSKGTMRNCLEEIRE